MATPRVEFLWWRGCPSWGRALEMLREAMEEVGLDPASLELREIDTEESAERLEFAGSPTILVNGADLQPPGDDEPVGLVCRVYHRRDGRVSPLPDPQDLREALHQAAE